MLLNITSLDWVTNNKQEGKAEIWLGPREGLPKIQLDDTKYLGRKSIRSNC